MTGGRNVLVFAPDDDGHAAAVCLELRRLGVRVRQAAYTSVLDASFAAEPGVVIEFDGVPVDGSWTIWWRRTGSVPPVDGIGQREQRLRAEETEALVLGALLSVAPRWVDEPYSVARAEHTLFQLSAAKRAGARIPATTATNVPAVADRLLSTGPCVAKATSSGVGLAPYADEIDSSLTSLLAQAPALVQRRIFAEADLRIVVVGSRAMIWSRPRRAGEPLDWRAVDPAGSGFVPASYPAVGDSASRITAQLGLSFSVQDWALADGQAWFLEANPAGQWLFLAGADRAVAPVLAEHLASVAAA